jgi:cysteine-rich repeat protein
MNYHTKGVQVVWLFSVLMVVAVTAFLPKSSIDGNESYNTQQLVQTCEEVDTSTLVAPLWCEYISKIDSRWCDTYHLVCSAFCGDGSINQETEECDDGNETQNDSCTNECKLPRCGDGLLQENEKCDPLMHTNSCSNDMLCIRCDCVYPAMCGDGFKQNDEECDDWAGNMWNPTWCNKYCKRCPELTMPEQTPWCSISLEINEETSCQAYTIECDADIAKDINPIQEDTCTNGLSIQLYPSCVCSEWLTLQRMDDQFIYNAITETFDPYPRSRCIVDLTAKTISETIQPEKNLNTSEEAETSTTEKENTNTSQAYEKLLQKKIKQNVESLEYDNKTP